MLIFSIFVVIEGVTHLAVMPVAGVVGILYAVWAIGQFYDQKKILNYLTVLAAYFLGMITFWIFPVLIGTVIDLLKKH